MSNKIQKYAIRCSVSSGLLRTTLSVCLFLLASLAQSQDNTAPVLALQSPSGDNATIQGEFTFSGSVTDAGGSGVRDVRYLLKDLGTGEFVSPGGVVESARVLRTADLSLNNANAGVWSVPVSLRSIFPSSSPPTISPMTAFSAMLDYDNEVPPHGRPR